MRHASRRAFVTKLERLRPPIARLQEIAALVANNLKPMREARGLSLVALAKLVGTSSQQISHLELGKRQLTVDWLMRLAAVLGCHPWTIASGLDPAELGERERQMVQAFGALTESQQSSVLSEMIAKARGAQHTKPRRARSEVASAE